MSNELLYNIHGLKVKYSEEEFEDVYYYSDDMLKDNVIITESTLFGEGTDVQTLISVKHFNDLDAQDWQLYWSELLAPIQVYRIIIDIHDLYRGCSKGHFFQLIDGLSVARTSSSMQTQKKNKDDIMNRIKTEIISLQTIRD